MNTYEEWRVTGACKHMSQAITHQFTTEDAARTWLTEWTCDWADGPHLHKRTVTVSEWTEVDT